MVKRSTLLVAAVAIVAMAAFADARKHGPKHNSKGEQDSHPSDLAFKAESGIDRGIYSPHDEGTRH